MQRHDEAAVGRLGAAALLLLLLLLLLLVVVVVVSRRHLRLSGRWNHLHGKVRGRYRECGGDGGNDCRAPHRTIQGRCEV